MIIGIDPSVSHTAIVGLDADNTKSYGTFSIGKDFQRDFEKILPVLREAATVADLFAMESCLYTQFHRNEKLIAVNYLLRQEIWRLGIPLLVIPPIKINSLVGEKSKIANRNVARKLYGPQIDALNEHEAEAVLMAHMGSYFWRLKSKLISTIEVPPNVLRLMEGPTGLLNKKEFYIEGSKDSKVSSRSDA